MKNYELTYLVSPDLSEKEVIVFQEKIISLIQELGGTLDEIKAPARKKGAYLTTLNFHLDSAKLGDLEKKLKAEGQVLRYIILTKKLPKKAPEKAPEITIKPKKIVKSEPKVELKEIEKKLEEILDESK